MSKGKKTQSEHKLIAINDNVLEVYDVLEYDHEKIKVENHTFPYADAVIKYNADGGLVFLYNCSLEYLQYTQNLAQLEESVVLKNVFDFGAKNKGDMLKFIIGVVAFIIVIFLVRR